MSLIYLNKDKASANSFFKEIPDKIYKNDSLQLIDSHYTMDIDSICIPNINYVI